MLLRALLSAAVYSGMLMTLSQACGSCEHYKTLGLEKTASVKEIKRAFRKMALELHPDKNQDDPEAEEKFIKISQAYEVLSNKDKKQQYDQFGSSEGGGGGGHHTHHDFNDFFKGFDEAFAGFRQNGPGSRHNHHHAHHHGKHRFGSIFDDMFDDDEDHLNQDFGSFDTFFGRPEFGGGHHGHHGHGRQKMRARGGGGFGDMDMGFGDNMGFGDMFADMEKQFGGGDFQFSSESSSSHNGGKHTQQFSAHSTGSGQRCRTVTKRTGNSISTSTICD